MRHQAPGQNADSRYFSSQAVLQSLFRCSVQLQPGAQGAAALWRVQAQADALDASQRVGQSGPSV